MDASGRSRHCVVLVRVRDRLGSTEDALSKEINFFYYEDNKNEYNKILRNLHDLVQNSFKKFPTNKNTLNTIVYEYIYL